NDPTGHKPSAGHGRSHPRKQLWDRPPVRFGTVTNDADPRDGTRPADREPARGADPAAVRGLLRGPRPRGGALRQPGPGRRPDAAVYEQRNGPIQGSADQRREAELYACDRLPTLSARRWQAQRFRGGGADAPPSHS